MARPKAKKKTHMPMTDQMRLFADEYLVDRNATAAAKRAGYKSPRNAGYRVFHHPEVQKYIKSKEKKLAKKLEITAERVLQELARIAFSDIRGYYEKKKIKGKNRVVLREVVDLSPETSSAIQSIKPGMFGTEFKLHDKVAALDKLCRHLGLFKEKEFIFNIEQLLTLSPEDLLKLAEQLETSDIDQSA